VSTASVLRCLSAALAAAALAAACGGGGGVTSTLEVGFSEWAIEVAPAEQRAGDLRFELRNQGALAHNLVIVKSDLPAAELPVAGGRVDVSRLNLAGGAGPIAPGTAMTGDAAYAASLTPGKYVLFCDIVAAGESHYENGMHASLLLEP
jgi:hypothetical protein